MTMGYRGRVWIVLASVLVCGVAAVAQIEPDLNERAGAADLDAIEQTDVGDSLTGPAALGADPESQRISLGAEIVSKVHDAGWIGYVLLALSVMGLGFAIERLVNLRRGRIVPTGLAERVRQHLIADRYDAAIEECSRHPSTLGRILGTVTRHREFSFADLNTIGGDIGIREIRQHVGRAYPMAVVATLSPLLGLLGTVIGMIEAFEAVALAGSMGDPSIMASSISFALVTTAMGLIIAAPNLALFHAFRVRTNNLATLLDEQVSEVLTEWQSHRLAQANLAHGSPIAATPAAHPSAFTTERGTGAATQPQVTGKETAHA